MQPLCTTPGVRAGLLSPPMAVVINITGEVVHIYLHLMVINGSNRILPASLFWFSLCLSEPGECNKNSEIKTILL